MICSTKNMGKHFVVSDKLLHVACNTWPPLRNILFWHICTHTPVLMHWVQTSLGITGITVASMSPNKWTNSKTFIWKLGVQTLSPSPSSGKAYTNPNPKSIQITNYLPCNLLKLGTNLNIRICAIF